MEPGLDASLYQYSPVEMRHGKRGNVGFLDGHAEARTLESLGYQLDDNGVATPILDPLSGEYTADNKLWSGQAYDEIARQHRPK